MVTGAVAERANSICGNCYANSLSEEEPMALTWD
jgi:hypothetical protein